MPILCLNLVTVLLFGRNTVEHSMTATTICIKEHFPIGKKTSTKCLEDVFSRQARHLTDILHMSKRYLKRKSERHLRKTS